MSEQVILSSAPQVSVAKRIARKLVDQRAAACVSIIDRCVSIYRWKGKRQETREVLLIIKSDSRRFKAVEKTILDMHPYDVPEIIALPVQTGNARYLKWLKESL